MRSVMESNSGFLADVRGEGLLAGDVLQQAGLDWDVETRQSYYQVTDDFYNVSMAPAPGSFHVVRTDTQASLGDVTSKYQPIQNRDALSLLDEVMLAGDEEVIYESAGCAKGGKVVWIQALDRGGRTDIVPGDPVDSTQIVLKRHDGKGSIVLFQAMDRIVCSNVLPSILKSGGCELRIRHTRSAMDRIEQAKRLMHASRRQHAQQVAMAKGLARTQMTTKSMEDFLDVVAPLGLTADGEVSTRSRNIRDNVLYLFENGKGQDIPGVRGTAWAALNAVTEYATHGRHGHNHKQFMSVVQGGEQRRIQKATEYLYAIAA